MVALRQLLRSHIHLTFSPHLSCYSPFAKKISYKEPMKPGTGRQEKRGREKKNIIVMDTIWGAGVLWEKESIFYYRSGIWQNTTIDMDI